MLVFREITLCIEAISGKKTGGKLDTGYSILEKNRASLGYTYHSTIKTPSEITATDCISTKTLASEFAYSFSTVSLMCNYTFGESEGNPVSVYTPVGISYVMVKYKEQLKKSVPAGYSSSDQMAPGKESGFIEFWYWCSI